ncbi:ribosomal protein S18-alanine N-acetyltransferase [Nocardioides sp.]|uniref:ribosomal protein S18-alanine N-acetyltransferase n=1 Tax=Nocardioides sp. TaxID=35761 RepID=UPI00351557E2
MAPDVDTARPADLAWIEELEQVAFPLDPWSPALLGEALEGRLPTTAVIAARDADGAALGYAVVAVVDVDAELQRIAVAPDVRGRGVGEALVRGVAELSRSRGATRLLLEVREDNAPALALYRRTGFGDLGRRERYYRDGTAALVLERPLTSLEHGHDATWEMSW